MKADRLNADRFMIDGCNHFVHQLNDHRGPLGGPSRADAMTLAMRASR
jgi:hypothetical protein